MSTQAQKAIKAVKARAAATAASDAEAVTRVPELPDNHWTRVSTNDVAVVLRGKTDKTVEVIRRTRAPNGQYLPPAKDPGETLGTVTATCLLSQKSTMAGCGNVGTGKDFVIHLGNCNFNIGLTIGDLKEGKACKELTDKQPEFFDWTYAMSRHIMGSVFDLNAPLWKLPIENALKSARQDLYTKIKPKDDEGNPIVLERYTDLVDIENADPAVKKRVHALAREMFIDKAKTLPGAEIVDENGVKRRRIFWVRRKCWKFANYKKETDSMSQEKGPIELPIDAEHWPQIDREMTDPKGKMRRKYSPIDYSDGSTGKPLLRPMIRVVASEIDPMTGESVKVAQTIENPFWDPCLKAENGKEKESLVAMKVIWSVYRGPKTSSDTYGLHLMLASPVSIVAQARKRTETVVVAGATGFGAELSDVEEDDAVAADAAFEEEAAAVTAEEEAEEGEVATIVEPIVVDPKKGVKRRAAEAEPAEKEESPAEKEASLERLAKRLQEPNFQTFPEAYAKVTVKRTTGKRALPVDDDDNDAAEAAHMEEDEDEVAPKKARLTKKAAKAVHVETDVAEEAVDDEE